MDSNKLEYKIRLASTIEWIFAAVSSEEIPSIIGFGSGSGSSSTVLGRAISSSSTAALEVKNGRAKATLDNCITIEETKSKYSVDPKNVEKRVTEIWTIEQGLSPCRFPAPCHLVKLHPLQSVFNWSDWIREQVLEMPSWQDKSVDKGCHLSFSNNDRPKYPTPRT